MAKMGLGLFKMYKNLKRKFSNPFLVNIRIIGSRLGFVNDAFLGPSLDITRALGTLL